MAIFTKGGNLGLKLTLDVSGAERKVVNVQREFRPSTLLKLIGQAHLFWINENFRRQGIETPWKPLAPSTISNPKRGGYGSQPLRNTGKLAASFTTYGVRVTESAVSVGTEVPYAKYHHFGGTKSYTIRPKNAKVLAFWSAKGMVFRREVKHPPLPKRPLLPSVGLAKKIATDVANAYVEQVTKNASA